MFTYAITVYENNGGSVVATNAKCESIATTYKIDESLDSALVVIPRLTRQELFQRFAPVKIVISDGTTTDTHWWLIYAPKAELSGYGTVKRYDHTLGLIEPTKWLEKFSCGSLTFTQPTGGTQYTMYDVVERLRQLTPFVPYADVATTRAFEIDSTFGTYLDTITAPQFYLDKKNLREALVEVLKYVNAIPRINLTNPSSGVFTFTLTADFINNRHLNFEIGDGIIDYSDESSGEDFAQKAEVYHENTVVNDDATQPSTRCIEFVSFRNNDVVLGESDLRLVFNNKIENLVSMKICLATADIVFEADFADYIYEKKVYDTLETQSGQGTQSCAVYWTYGSNEILGFSETFGAIFPTTAIKNIMVLIEGAINTNSETTVVFKVEYDAYVETMRSEQYREDKIDVGLFSSFQSKYATLELNAQERINNLYKLTNNIYGQVQRLGVDTVGFTKKHHALLAYNGSNDGVYSLGDYTDDGYFITNLEYVYYNNFLIGRYEASKNFNRIAQFLAIDKEFRPYEITLTKSDYTLKRNILMPFITVELSASSNANHGVGLSANYSTMLTSFMNTFRTSNYENQITGASFNIDSTSSVTETVGVYLPIIASAEKNTLKFKLDFRDTKLAGNRVETALVVATSVLHQKQVIYTEDDGTLDYAKIELYKAYWDYPADYISNVAVDGMNAVICLRAIAEQMPYIDTSKNICTVYATVEFTNVQHIEALEDTFYSDVAGRIVGDYYFGEDTQKVWLAITPSPYWTLIGYRMGIKNDADYTLPIYKIDKDRSEIIGLEMSMPIVPNKDEINKFIVGDMLTKDNCLIRPRTAKTLKYYYSTTPFTKANTDKPTMVATAYTTPSVTTNYIDVPSLVYTTYDYYALGDNDGNLYFAVNQKALSGTKTNVSRVYFNFLKERS